MPNDGLILPDTHISLISAPDINEICTNFMDQFGINYFRFLRIYKNGSRICLSTNPTWTKYFFEKNFYNIAWFDNKGADFYKSDQVLWDHKATTEDNEVGIAARTGFNMHHGYTIIRSSDSCCDFFDFTANNDNHIINHLYTNYQELFNHFTFYFKDQARKIIDNAEKSKIILPEIRHKIWHEEEQNDLKKKVDSFIKQTKIKKFFIDKDIYLSKKEIEVILLCSKGMTMKEIARITGNSDRTVETHMCKARQKLKCENSIELLRLCYDMGIIF